VAYPRLVKKMNSFQTHNDKKKLTMRGGVMFQILHKGGKRGKRGVREQKKKKKKKKKGKKGIKQFSSEEVDGKKKRREKRIKFAISLFRED